VARNLGKEEKVMQLLGKECREMKEFEAERLVIQQNTINNQPVFKQLHFETVSPSVLSIRPTHYNVQSLTRTASRGDTLDRSQTLNNILALPQSSKSYTMELSVSTQKSDENELRLLRKKSSKRKQKKVRES
jgi:hypothetical protein